MFPSHVFKSYKMRHFDCFDPIWTCKSFELSVHSVKLIDLFILKMHQRERYLNTTVFAGPLNE